MASINVIIKNKDILELAEDAKRGDIIELDKITNIDLSYINKYIDETFQEELNKRVQEKVEDALKNQRTELELKYREENRKIKENCESIVLKCKDENTKNLAINNEALHKKDLEIIELKNQISSFEQNRDKDIELIKANLQNDYEKQLNQLKNDNMLLTQQNQYLEKTNRIEIDQINIKNNADREHALNELRNQLTAGFNEKEKEYLDKISALERLKSSLNIKNIGEDLETWCDREVNSYMQNGFFNCTWEKDNLVIKTDDESKGSKADFIFKIFSDETHKDLLTSICLDMKDENPDSKNKKTNKDYYSQLDKNRKKKECKYAVLVSNLEADKTNDIPIFKVNEYPDMYVVRPAYLMTFLNMIVSLTTRFSKLILDSQKEQEKFQSYTELKETFESIKSTYLDKPLSSLKDKIQNIRKQNEDILKANKAIGDAVYKANQAINDIEDKYINDIQKKLEKFDVKILKAYKSVSLNYQN